MESGDFIPILLLEISIIKKNKRSTQLRYLNNQLNIDLIGSLQDVYSSLLISI